MPEEGGNKGTSSPLGVASQQSATASSMAQQGQRPAAIGTAGTVGARPTQASVAGTSGQNPNQSRQPTSPGTAGTAATAGTRPGGVGAPPNANIGAGARAGATQNAPAGGGGGVGARTANPSAGGNAAGAGAAPNNPQAMNALISSLFSGGTTCVTAPSGTLPIKEDMRGLFALFSNGRFLVSDAHKFDGRVLSFEVLARKKRLQVGKPEYVSAKVISAIYEKAASSSMAAFAPAVGKDDDGQLQMQRDFVTIIARAAAVRVSDIHVVVADKTSIMFRINGLMQTEIEYSNEWGEAFVRAAFASADISDANYSQNEYQAAQKLGSTPLRGSKGKLMLPKSVLGVRLQFNPIAFGSRYLVMRLLYADDSSQDNSLASLGYGPREEEIFFRLRNIPTGIVIVSGPTGSGKSTTLQRNMIKLLEEKNYEVNLLTVEDPPEYPIPGARQMPVTNANTEAEKDLEFNRALAATLRSDPDILMIGEIRTLASAQLAFKGALSGHSVWSTLHANSAPAVLMRLRDMGMEPFKLQDPTIIKGMIAQRLFRKLCPYCRVPAIEQTQNPAVKRLIKAFDDFGVGQAFLRGPGCQYCNQKGVKGRVAVGEMIMPDAHFLEMLIDNNTKEAIEYWTGDLSGRTLKENALEKMLLGEIDIEEIERWCGLLDEKAVY